jgi:hypothetical protein
MKRKQFIRRSATLLTMASMPALSATNESEALIDAARVCATCGTHFNADYKNPLCQVCSDDRQYIPDGGQLWTSHDAMLRNFGVRILKLTDKLFELQIKPTFGIGQRALLVLSPQGNVLWDCIPLLNDATIEFIRSKGGLKAIAFSHPHYYSNMNNWAEVFDCPLYIHKSDEDWVLNRGRYVTLWSGETKDLWDEMTIHNIGGHFPGSSILRVPALSKNGAVMVGDTLTLSPSHRHIAVMYSYPNRIPLPVTEMARIRRRVDKIPFDALYGFYSDQNLTEDVRQILTTSFDKYQ